MITSRKNLNKLYGSYTSKYPDVPTALLQDAMYRAGENVKTYNSNIPAYNERRKEYNKRQVKRNKIRTAKGLAPFEPKPMLEKWNLAPRDKNSFNYRLDARTITHRGENITFSAIGKRVVVPFVFPEWFTNKYDIRDWKLGSGTVNQKDGKIFMTITVSQKSIPLKEAGSVVGVDLGQKHKYVTSEGYLHDSRHISRKKRGFAYNRGLLRQKGTRSARLKLKKLSGKESRFMKDADHCMSKELANNKHVKTYVFEDLTGIRKTKKGKTHNRNLSNQSFRRLQFFTLYKCYANGIAVVFTDPYMTSQTCNVCGAKGERHKGLFTCTCGNKTHADINAARNIRDNYLLQGTRGRPLSTGQTASEPTVKRRVAMSR
jgi:IS605 OrfB family transposase